MTDITAPDPAKAIEALAAQVAAIAASRHDVVLDAIHSVEAKQSEMESHLLRIEGIATDALAVGKQTNGRVTMLELWRAEMKGIAQGSGGAGRLLLYILSAAAAFGSVVAFVMKLLER